MAGSIDGLLLWRPVLVQVYWLFSALLPGGKLSQGLAQPLGLSFYSFTLVGYVFDVYRGKIQLEKNPICFFAFASFFPSLLSGPINRAGDLTPQIKAAKRIDSTCWKAGLWRFLKGAAKKLLVAGMLGSVIDTVYAAPESYGGGIWLMTASAYSLYIYADFSSYRAFYDCNDGSWPELDSQTAWYVFLHYNVYGAVPFSHAMGLRLEQLGLCATAENADLWQ